MQLEPAIRDVFSQLSASLSLLTTEQYCAPSGALSGSSIGQHTRHVIEMFQCLETGYQTGVVNYEKRKRDELIETDISLALSLLTEVQMGIGKSDRNLTLEMDAHDQSAGSMSFPTHYYREIVYTLDHAIHHMAMIKIGMKDLNNLEMPANYGMAFSTVKHHACAQ